MNISKNTVVKDPIGPENIGNLIRGHSRAALTVCAWGNSPIMKKLQKRFPEYLPLTNFKDLCYLDLAVDGTPKHPLYLKGDLEPTRYEGHEPEVEHPKQICYKAGRNGIPIDQECDCPGLCRESM